MPQQFKISDVMKSVAKKYRFEENGSNEERLKKKIKDICEKKEVETRGGNGQLIRAPLWQVSKRGENSRGDHLFTYEELRIILTSEALYEYIQNNIKPLECSEQFKKDKELAEKWTTAAREDFDAEPFEIPEGFSVPGLIKEEDLEKKKFQIMIEALFLRYFTPVDMDLLRSDMELVGGFSWADDYTPELVAAHRRLTTNCGYYEERKPESETRPKKEN